MTNVVNINEGALKINVLWSSGLDSTYLVYSLLEQGHCVNAQYFEVENNSKKSKHELQQRDRMAVFFKQKYGYKFIYSKTPTAKILINDVGTVKLVQALAWISCSILTLREECQYMAIGYVKGDDAIEFLEDIKNAFNALKKLSYSEAELIFPMKDMDKKTIYENLPDELKDEIFWCEYGDTKGATCWCKPCIKAREYGILSKYQYSKQLEEYKLLKDEESLRYNMKVAAE